MKLNIGDTLGARDYEGIKGLIEVERFW